MSKVAAVVIIIVFYVSVAFSFCEIIPQSIEEAREFLFENTIDSACFNALEILFVNPVEPLNEGWSRLESIGFDLTEEEYPTSRELLGFAGNVEGLFKKYPLLSEFEPFIFISEKTQKDYPVKSTISVSARRTDGDDEQYYSISSHNKFGENLQVSLQFREQKHKQYLQNRAVLYKFENKNFSGRLNVGNLTSPGNELLFGRYESFKQAQGIQNLYYGSAGGYNGVIAQLGTKNLGASGYFHTKASEHLSGGGFFLQPQNFRLETIALHAEKPGNAENLLQIRGSIYKTGISLSNAFSINSQKNASLLRYEKTGGKAKILSQIWFMQNGFNSPFSSLIAKSDTLGNQKFGAQVSLSGKTKTQKYSFTSRYIINGDFGTANIIGSYYFPEITGLGCRTNITIKSDSTFRQSYTVFNQKKIGSFLKTNISCANSFEKSQWKQTTFNVGLDGFLPYKQVVHFGFSEKLRSNSKPSQETIFLSYKSTGSSKNTRSFSVDVPLYETAKGLRIYGEMRFVFPFRAAY